MFKTNTTAFLVSGAILIVASTTQAIAAPAFVNGLAISGATGDQFGSSVNNGRLGFFSDITTIPTAMSGGDCRIAVLVAGL